MIGKVGPKDLEKFVFSRLGKKDKNVILGPKYGEDMAAVKIGKRYLIAHSDPIIFAADRIGKLGVHIVCNDIAVSGARPRWLLSVFFLPKKNGREILDKITKQIDQEAKKLGVSIIGGHSEYAPEVSRPFISMTCLGITEGDSYVSTSGAKVGDLVLITKSAGIEGAGIIATDFQEKLKEAGLSENIIKKAEDKLEEISVVEDALAISDLTNSMHDPTEGGILGGLWEIASASGKNIEVWEEKIPVKEEIKKVCKVMSINPLKVFGSGALLAAIPEEKKQIVLKRLKKKGIESAIIGEVKGKSKKPVVKLHRKKEIIEVKGPVREELYKFWE